MNVFKTYSISLIVIFILSLKTLDAPSNKEIQENIKNCTNAIKTVFTGNVYGQAELAFKQFELNINEENPDLTHCTQEIDENKQEVYFGDVLAYYCSFDKYLLDSLIPELDEFCGQYSIVLENPEGCFSNLEYHFTSNKHTALRKAFYKYRSVESCLDKDKPYYGNLPLTILKIVKPKNDEEANEQNAYMSSKHMTRFITIFRGKRYMNMSLAYFVTLKTNFRLKILSAQYKEVDQMRNPLDFCTIRYTPRKDEGESSTSTS